MITWNKGNVNENFSSNYFTVIEEVLSGEKRIVFTHICHYQYPVTKMRFWICESQVIK